MKKLRLSFLLVAVACLTGAAQKAATKPHPLQSGKWYATGAFDGKAITLSQQKGNSDWEATFAASGYLHNCSSLKKPVVDATGAEVKAGTFYCDTVYVYTIKNNTLNINYLQSAYAYKITADKGGYVLTPVANPGSSK